MRLLSPSPGEIIDRLTILELKIVAAEHKGISYVHFEAEKVALEERLAQFNECLAKDFGMFEKDKFEKRQEAIVRNRTELTAVNSLIWQAEDEVRATPRDAAFKLAGLCKRIATWNDGRAKHIHILDRLYGLDDGPEKLHATAIPTKEEIGI